MDKRPLAMSGVRDVSKSHQEILNYKLELVFVAIFLLEQIHLTLENIYNSERSLEIKKELESEMQYVARQCCERCKSVVACLSTGFHLLCKQSGIDIDFEGQIKTEIQKAQDVIWEFVDSNRGSMEYRIKNRLHNQLDEEVSLFDFVAEDRSEHRLIRQLTDEYDRQVQSSFLDAEKDGGILQAVVKNSVFQAYKKTQLMSGPGKSKGRRLLGAGASHHAYGSGLTQSLLTAKVPIFLKQPGEEDKNGARSQAHVTMKGISTISKSKGEIIKGFEGRRATGGRKKPEGKNNFLPTSLRAHSALFGTGECSSTQLATIQERRKDLQQKMIVFENELTQIMSQAFKHELIWISAKKFKLALSSSRETLAEQEKTAEFTMLATELQKILALQEERTHTFALTGQHLKEKQDHHKPVGLVSKKAYTFHCKILLESIEMYVNFFISKEEDLFQEEDRECDSRSDVEVESTSFTVLPTSTVLSTEKTASILKT